MENELGRGGSVLHSHIAIHPEGAQDRNSNRARRLEGGADAEAMQGYANWLTHPRLLSLVLHSTTHNGLGPPLSTTS